MKNRCFKNIFYILQSLFKNVARRGMEWFNMTMLKETQSFSEELKTDEVEDLELETIGELGEKLENTQSINNGSEKESAEIRFRRLFGRLSDFVSMGKLEETPKFKKIFEEEFPEYNEFIESVFGLIDLIFMQKQIDERPRKFEPRDHLFRELTEYHFLISHFVITHDAQTVKAFWEIGERVSRRYEIKNYLSALKKGILSQAGVVFILDELDLSPHLSHPDQDAFEKTDLWVGDSRLQIKASKEVVEPAIISTTETAFPSIRTRRWEKRKYFNSNYAFEMTRFKAVIRKLDPEAQGFMLVIPIRMIDSITGKPTKELVDFFREKLTTLGIIPEER